MPLKPGWMPLNRASTTGWKGLLRRLRRAYCAKKSADCSKISRGLFALCGEPHSGRKQPPEPVRVVGAGWQHNCPSALRDFWSNPLGNVPASRTSFAPCRRPCSSRCFAGNRYFRVKGSRRTDMPALPMAGGTHMLLRGFAGAAPRFSINKTKGRGLLLPFLNPSRQYPLWVTAVPQRGGFFIFAAPFRAGS